MGTGLRALPEPQGLTAEEGALCRLASVTTVLLWPYRFLHEDEDLLTTEETCRRFRFRPRRCAARYARTGNVCEQLYSGCTVDWVTHARVLY